MSVVPQELLDLIPVVAQPVDVAVDIDRITVRDDGEAVGGAEPYLLLSFFKIDGTTAKIEATIDVSTILEAGAPLIVEMEPADGRDSFVEVVRRGEQGNVDEVNVGPIELHFDGPKELSIDSSVGLFTTSLTPIPITLTLDGGDVQAGVDIDGLPGFVGVHVMLFEDDFTPDDAIDAAHEVVTDGLKAILTEVLSEMDISDLSVDPANFTEKQAEIEDDAAAAAAAEMDAWELFWGGVIDPDDPLINRVEFVNVLQLSNPVPIEEHYNSEHGNYLLAGEIRLD